MAGSRGGKHSKSKGKSKQKKSDTIRQKPEEHNSKLDLAQVLNNINGPMGAKEKNLQPNITYSSATSIYAENELEKFLYVKLNRLYTAAHEWLLTLGYCNEEVETAILNAGYIHGEMDFLNNIMANSIGFIEEEFNPKREAFKDTGELYKTMIEALVDYIMQIRPDMQRSEAMWHLVVRSWDHVSSATATSHLQSENEDADDLDPSSSENVPSDSNTDSSLKKVGILKRINLTPALASHLRLNVRVLTDAVKREINASIFKQQAIPGVSGKLTEKSDFLSSYEAWLESSSDDPKTGLVKKIKDLQEEVKERKKWAQQKVTDSARRLSKHFLELNTLRMEKEDKEEWEKEIFFVEKSCMLKLMETEQSLRQVKFEASLMNNAVKRLETENGQIRAETEAFSLNGLESERNLKEVMKREKKCTKKLADVENLTSILRSQCEEEKQRVLQLEQELLQAEKEAEEAEMKWRQEIKEKEHTFALLAEETRKAEIQKAQSRAQLLKLRQKVEVDSQLARDNHQSLEAKLCRLRMSLQMPDTFLEDPNFWRDDFKAVSLESSAPCESSEKTRHWICMICLENEVSMVLLPCTHQVICFHCYEKSFKIEGAQCPYCHVRIEDSIRVYGLSS